MHIIKVTSLSSKKPIYININMIGHFFEVEETRKYGHTVDKPKHSRIGVTTHNNGGFEVIESVDTIAKRIINAGNGLANIIKE
jgi:hypothetical protein